MYMNKHGYYNYCERYEKLIYIAMTVRESRAFMEDRAGINKNI